MLAAAARVASPQTPVPPPAATVPAAAPAPPPDPFGRDTPRGTVLGFLAAGRKGDDRLARHYLNTRLGDDTAEQLAHQLFVVLDKRLPAHLIKVSDVPEGSRADPLAPDLEPIGRIAGVDGPIDVVVERVRQKGSGPVWLFSPKTLDAIPATYDDVSNAAAETWLPRFLVERRIGAIPLGEWLAVLLGLPILYLFTGLLNRVLSPIVAWAGKRFFHGPGIVRNALPAPARLLILSIAAAIWGAAPPRGGPPRGSSPSAPPRGSGARPCRCRCWCGRSCRTRPASRRSSRSSGSS